jgi:hypothetical protein
LALPLAPFCPPSASGASLAPCCPQPPLLAGTVCSPSPRLRIHAPRTSHTRGLCRYALVVRQLLSGGLDALYFDNQWLQGSPVTSRVDPVLDFNWGLGLVTAYGRDYVSARWTGKVLAPVSEVFTFFVYADNAVRMWIDHDLVRTRANGHPLPVGVAL